MMSVSDWIERQAPSGRYTFSKEDVRKEFPDMTQHAIDMAVQRAVIKGRIFSPYRSFYVVVPEEYRLWKAVPQEVYLDRMMQYLGRTYYVALLSAAERHGAAHQAPMGFQVMVEPPVLRDKERDGYAIRYAERRQIPMDYVERKEVPTGWMNVSGPELTAIDLIAYHDHVGGLTRAATVLEELALKLDFSRLDTSFLQVAPASVFQRLGYLLDHVLEEESLADDLLSLMKSGGLKTKAVPLRLGASAEGAQVDKKWKVEVNQEIEIDE
ncbi:MAG: type IV toxin-antitoxin system AbiEi family antitoxin [Bacteroidales bacterium]|nr:type IV toxin-antitoxin system AbiEi family antitoxin [Bacteroidales bacterium]